MMHGREKSDLAIGAAKPANNDGRPSAELVEQRAGAEGNAGQDRTRRAQNRASVSQGLDRVRHVLPSDTQGGSRVPELGPLGSVRGRSVMSVPTAIKATRVMVSVNRAALAAVISLRTAPATRGLRARGSPRRSPRPSPRAEGPPRRA